MHEAIITDFIKQIEQVFEAAGYGDAPSLAVNKLALRIFEIAESQWDSGYECGYETGFDDGIEAGIYRERNLS